MASGRDVVHVAGYDFQKRAFLKTFATLGVGVFIWSILPKRANASVFGSAPSRLDETDRLVKNLYKSNKGTTFIVSGPKIKDSDPPRRSAKTEKLIEEYVENGIPEENIIWNVVGESSE